MYKYKYTGQVEVHISGVGVFKPGETRGTEKEINHPDFTKVNEAVKNNKFKKHI
jgi:hypothetical protein